MGGDQTTTGPREPSCFPVANRLTADAVSSEICLPPLYLQRRAFWNDTFLNEAPQGDRQLSCESDDANLAAAHPRSSKPLVPPERQFAVWLVAEPKPRQFDERLPRELGTGFAYASISARFPACVRTRSEPDKRCHMPPGLKRAVVDLGNQYRCGRLSNRSKHRQTVNLLSVWKFAGLVRECRFSIRFDFLDLIAKKLIVPKHAFNITAKKRRQLTPVSRFDMVEALLQTFSDPLAPQVDAVECEETLDPTDNAYPLFNQVLALSFDPFRVFFFNSRNLDIARHFAIT